MSLILPSTFLFQGEFNVAIDTAFDYRHQLGLPTPKNKPAGMILIIKEFIKTNRALGNKTAEDIANLPDLTDERIVMGQRMLELSTFSSFQVSSLCIIIIRECLLTLLFSLRPNPLSIH